MTGGVPLAVPQMGVVEEIVVLEWLVDDGAAVFAGDAVVLIETEKAETELDAPASGKLEILVAPSDEEVPVGTVLANIVTS